MAPADEAQTARTYQKWLHKVEDRKLRSRSRVLPLGGALSEYPKDEACRIVVFADRRVGVSKDSSRTLAVTEIKALAAHEFWHRRTGQSWADYRWRSDLSEGLSGELLEIRPLKAAGPQPRNGAEVVLRFWRVEHPRWEVTVNGQNVAGRLRPEVIDVLFEVQEQCPTQFYVCVAKEQPPLSEKQEWDSVLAGKPEAHGIVKLSDILDGGEAARRSARALTTPSRHEPALLLRSLA